MSALQTVKLFLVDHLGLAKDALHIYVSLLIMFGSAMVFRWPLRSWKPWVLVLAAALIGEAWDIRDRMVGQIPQNFPGNWHDIWNTMFWPTAILLLARGTRVLSRDR